MNAEKILITGLNELDISCTAEQISSFLTYLAELKKWNRAYNLTALRTDRDIIVKHFLDSLLYLRAFPEGALKIVDAGTGAGFPGIPIKIVRPAAEVLLVDSSRKKAAFLRHMIRSLKLTGIDVMEQRLEHPGREHEKAYDVIVSRATFSVSEFLKIACPYVKENGRLILNKGPKLPEELKEAGTAEAVKEVLNLRLPIIHDERRLVVLGCEKSA